MFFYHTHMHTCVVFVLLLKSLTYARSTFVKFVGSGKSTPL